MPGASQLPWGRDPPGLSYLAGAAWADGGRMRRIRKRLTVEAADRKLSPAEVGAVQADVTSERAVDLVPALLRMLETAQDDAARRHTRWRGYPARAPAGPRPTTDDRRSDIDTVVALLRAWDGRFSLDSAAASVWAAFWERWQHRVAAARFPGHLVSLAQ